MTTITSFPVWQRQANKMFQIGTEPYSVAILYAFASYIISKQNHEGIILNISLPTDGKKYKTSNAAKVAYSVWGDARYLQTTSGFTEREPESIKRDMQEIIHNKELFLIESTMPLYMLSNVNCTNIIQIDCANPIDDDTLNLMLVNRTYAGDTFQGLCEQPDNADWLESAWQHWYGTIQKLTRLSVKYTSWIDLCAGVACASQLLSESKMLEFSPERIMDYLLKQVVQNYQKAIN